MHDCKTRREVVQKRKRRGVCKYSGRIPSSLRPSFVGRAIGAANGDMHTLRAQAQARSSVNVLARERVVVFKDAAHVLDILGHYARLQVCAVADPGSCDR